MHKNRTLRDVWQGVVGWGRGSCFSFLGGGGTIFVQSTRGQNLILENRGICGIFRCQYCDRVMWFGQYPVAYLLLFSMFVVTGCDPLYCDHAP